MKRRGFSLPEILIGLVVLSGLMVGSFMIFDVGVSGFQVGTNRLDIQSDLRRILAPLRRDLRNSSFQSITAIRPGTGPGVGVRDGVCMAGLQESAGGALYNPSTGMPQWNCFVLYFATEQQGTGSMVRALLDDPTPGRTVASPLEGFNTTYLSYPNVPHAMPGSVCVLSRQVVDFEVNTRVTDQAVDVRLHLRAPKVRVLQGRRELAEMLEVKISLRPANTWPRL